MVFSYKIEQNVWILNFSDQNDKTKNIPAHRSDSGLVFLNNNLYVFGGCDGVNKFNDLWLFKISESLWQNIDTNTTNVSRPLVSNYLFASKIKILSTFFHKYNKTKIKILSI